MNQLTNTKLDYSPKDVAKMRPNFFDKYSLVTRITSIQVLITIITLHILEIYKMDVETTFSEW